MSADPRQNPAPGGSSECGGFAGLCVLCGSGSSVTAFAVLAVGMEEVYLTQASGSHL